MGGNRTSLLGSDPLIKLATFRLGKVSKMDNHFVSEPFANLLERKAFCFWEVPDNERQVDCCENDEEEIILPADLSESRRSGLEVSDCRKEQNGQRECKASRSDVSWEDL